MLTASLYCLRCCTPTRAPRLRRRGWRRSSAVTAYFARRATGREPSPCCPSSAGCTPTILTCSSVPHTSCSARTTGSISGSLARRLQIRQTLRSRAYSVLGLTSGRRTCWWRRGSRPGSPRSFQLCPRRAQLWLGCSPLPRPVSGGRPTRVCACATVLAISAQPRWERSAARPERIATWAPPAGWRRSRATRRTTVAPSASAPPPDSAAQC
mmetsp:Transcript_20112/g.65353  ORF Transcript_20112/g.65353 Transcript_20112/m.65353 type:complete len:211 (+) Transcript_20112:1395-2027(+)